MYTDVITVLYIICIIQGHSSFFSQSIYTPTDAQRVHSIVLCYTVCTCGILYTVYTSTSATVYTVYTVYKSLYIIYCTVDDSDLD